MEIITMLGIALGVGFVSGINCYATVFAIGFMGKMGWITLSQPFDVLSSWPVIVIAGIMYAGEFFADKIPAFDSVWDSIHTFIRPIVGAAAAAGAVGTVNPEILICAGLLGGAVATTSHLTKAATRLVINLSPEPVSNSVASVAEDGIVVAGVAATFLFPWLMGLLVLLFLFVFILLAPRVIRRAMRFLGFGRKAEALTPAMAGASAVPAAAPPSSSEMRS